MECLQEADRIVMLAGVILDRYPERASESFLRVALDWCLRIYYKIATETRVTRAGKSAKSATSATTTGTASADSQQQQQQQQQQKQVEENHCPGTVFSARIKYRCRVQVSKVAKLLKRYEELDHKYFYSWLTVEFEALEEHQKAEQQRMIQKCCEGLSVDLTMG
ncbi:hypothetical protein BGZ65_010340, partial [Modicella reniformis]